MWSQLWNSQIVENIKVSESMSFCWAPDPLSEMQKTTFTHFAGQPKDGSFQKTQYQNPFLEDLSTVKNKTNCAWFWKELIEKYKSRCYSKSVNETFIHNKTEEKTISYPF